MGNPCRGRQPQQGTSNAGQYAALISILSHQPNLNKEIGSEKWTDLPKFQNRWLVELYNQTSIDTDCFPLSSWLLSSWAHQGLQEGKELYFLPASYYSENLDCSHVSSFLFMECLSSLEGTNWAAYLPGNVHTVDRGEQLFCVVRPHCEWNMLREDCFRVRPGKKALLGAGFMLILSCILFFILPHLIYIVTL